MSNKTNFTITDFSSFLADSGFIKLPEYQYSRETYYPFIGNGIIINIMYDGGYIVTILKPLFDMECLIDGSVNISDCRKSDFDLYNILNIGDQVHFNSLNSPSKELAYFKTLLMLNPQILAGKLSKLKWYSIMWNKITSFI